MLNDPASLSLCNLEEQQDKKLSADGYLHRSISCQPLVAGLDAPKTYLGCKKVRTNSMDAKTLVRGGADRKDGESAAISSVLLSMVIPASDHTLSNALRTAPALSIYLIAQDLQVSTATIGSQMAPIILLLR